MFLDLFPRPKPIMAMLHLKGENRDDILARAIREADIYAAGGVDAMIVEDYYGDSDDVERVLAVLERERPHYIIGVNVLDDFAKSYELAAQYHAKFMQVDSVCGHLHPDDEPAYFAMIDGYRRTGTVAVIGGVRFKYQPYLSGRSLADDLAIGRQYCDAIAVTGAGTGVDTDMQKIHEFRTILADKSGATAIEYGLIAALVATGAVLAMGALGNSLSNTFNLVSTNMNNAADGKL
jgi:predicted TIM-barrel enzyme